MIEIIKTLYALTKTVPKISAVNSLGVFNTRNQLKALQGIARFGHFSGELLPLFSLSRRALINRLLVWSLKPFVYPFYFVNSENRAALYQTCFLSGVIAYNSKYVNKIKQLGVKTLYISNDHSGDIYILSIILREHKDLRVEYVQHGAVKSSFPENYFNRIYVYNEKYAEIYRKLSRNPKVDITIEVGLAGAIHDNLPEIDLLICFSHQFPVYSAVSLARALRKIPNLVVAARFHPSDRLFNMKLFLLNLFYRVQLSDSSIGFLADFNRSKLIVCASSSLLQDAVEKGFSSRLVWAKQLGLNWDYYGLAEKVKVSTSSKDVLYFLKYRE